MTFVIAAILKYFIKFFNKFPQESFHTAFLVDISFYTYDDKTMTKVIFSDYETKVHFKMVIVTNCFYIGKGLKKINLEL